MSVHGGAGGAQLEQQQQQSLTGGHARTPSGGGSYRLGVVTSSGCCGDRSRCLPLNSYDSIPVYLRGNRWVVGGYRVNYSVSQCIHSAFHCNNETANIWSHGLGLLLFSALYVRDMAFILPALNAPYSDYIVLSATFASFNYCMVCSALFHVFNAHSQRCYSSWLALDISGITVAGLGCYVSGVYFAYYCYDFWRNVYVWAIGAVCVLCLAVQVADAVEDTHRSLRRVFLFTCLAGVAAVPVSHWLVLEGGWSPTAQKFVPKVGVMYGLLLLAVVLYLSKFPERWFPGRFDLIGHSHNLWHVVAVGALLWWHHSGLQFLTYRLEGNC